VESGQKIIERLHLVSFRCNTHDVDHPCPFCIEEDNKKREIIDLELAAQMEQKQKERKEHPEYILAECGVGKRYWPCSFESFNGADKTKAVLRKCIDQGESILLTGNIGSGKTHFSIAVLRELIINFKVNSHSDACFISVPELLMLIRDTYGTGIHTELEVFTKYANIPYLILDDIGAEKSTDWTMERLYMIINHRNDALLPTIYTTNLSLPEIEQHLGPRIASRIAQATVITLDLPDYRRKRAPLRVAQNV
jgi:DNA replication protein DnaC